ncbi:MAG: oligosaccharide flippase family protein [Symploca sp. SIO1B1]|nr:oligosaccharide flippase family protein [Symploca sp. SIO1B1]
MKIQLFTKRLINLYNSLFKTKRANSAAYALIMLLSSAFSFLKFFILGSILSKNDFGQYTYLNLIIQYGTPIISLGILEGLSRRFPIMLGEKKNEQAIQFRNACLGCIILLSLSILILGTVTAAFIEKILDTVLIPYVFLSILEMVAFVLFWFGLRELRSRLQLLTYSIINFSRTTLDLLFTVLFATYFGVLGILSSEIIILFIFALIIFNTLLPNIRISLKLTREILSTAKEGIVITFGSILANTGLSGDQIVLGYFLPKSEYAVYSIHMLLAKAALIITNILYQYVTPYILRLYGECKRYRSILNYLDRISLIFLSLGTLGFFIFPNILMFLYKQFFANYTINQYLLMTIYIGIIFQIVNLFPIAIIAVGKLWLRVGIQVIVCLFVLSFTYLSINSSLNHNLINVVGLVFLGGRLLDCSLSFITTRWIIRSVD